MFATYRFDFSNKISSVRHKQTHTLSLPLLYKPMFFILIIYRFIRVVYTFIDGASSHNQYLITKHDFSTRKNKTKSSESNGPIKE